MNKKLFSLMAVLTLSTAIYAQEETDNNKVTLSGSIQSDVLIPQEDTKIGSPNSLDTGIC